jgi:hypothetical protein
LLVIISNFFFSYNSYPSANFCDDNNISNESIKGCGVYGIFMCKNIHIPQTERSS